MVVPGKHFFITYLVNCPHLLLLGTLLSYNWQNKSIIAPVIRRESLPNMSLMIAQPKLTDHLGLTSTPPCAYYPRGHEDTGDEDMFVMPTLPPIKAAHIAEN